MFSYTFLEMEVLLKSLYEIGLSKFDLNTALIIAEDIDILDKKLSAFNKIYTDLYSESGLKELEEKRIAICLKYCIKDGKGLPISSEGQFLFKTKEDSELANCELKSLEDSDKVLWNKKVEADKKNEELRSTPVEIHLKKFSVSSCEEKIPPVKLVPILPLLLDI